MDVQVTGSGQNSAVEAQVDMTFQSLRANIKPAEYQSAVTNINGGHYKLGFLGGSLAGALTAPNQILSIRWADSTRVFVLERMSIGVLCTAFSTGISLDVAAYVARNFTSNSSGTGSTTPTPTRMRFGMPNSQFINSGEFRVHGTVALTAGSQTLDTSPFAYWLAQITAVQQAPYTDFVRRIELAGHPVLLVANEGIVLRLETLNLPVSNTIRLFGTIEWFETAVF